MKKVISFVLVFCMCLCLAACKNKDGNKEITSPDTKNEQTVKGATEEKDTEKPDSTDGSTPVPQKIEDLAVDEHTESFFSSLPKELVFSSGAGGWSTVLTINPNGTFYGEYHDSEMGVTGDKFPNGTYYQCSFSGKFSTPLPLDQYTYVSSIESIDIKTTVGEITYEDGVKYENTTPYGLENAKEVVFYLPGAPKASLPESFLNWVTPHYAMASVLPAGVYGMYSFNDEAGFVGKK